MADVEIDVFGIPFLRRKLDNIGDRIVDIEPALESIASDMRVQAGRAFDSRGLTSGTAWPPLQDSTISRKLRDKNAKTRANAHRILHATERLRKSLTSESHNEHISRVDRNSLEFGTSVPYAGFHQTGTRNMSARPPVRMREFQRKRAVRKVARYISTGIVL